MENYKEELEIDQDDLDTACIKQPILFDHYAQKLIPLYKKKAELNLMIEQTYARLDGIIRESASAEGKKITEVKIQNEINSNPQYTLLQDKYLNICSEVRGYEAIKDAFLQRWNMLRLLVDLYINGYWSSVEPKTLKTKRNDVLAEKLKDKMESER